MAACVPMYDLCMRDLTCTCSAGAAIALAVIGWHTWAAWVTKTPLELAAYVVSRMSIQL